MDNKIKGIPKEDDSHDKSNNDTVEGEWEWERTCKKRGGVSEQASN